MPENTCPHFLTTETCSVCKRDAVTLADNADILTTRRVVVALTFDGTTHKVPLHTFAHEARGKVTTRATVAHADHADNARALAHYASRGLDLVGVALSSPTVGVGVTNVRGAKREKGATVTLTPSDSGKVLQGHARFEHDGEWLRVDVTARPFARGRAADREEGWNVRAVARPSRAPRETVDAPDVPTAVATIAALVGGEEK